MDYRAPEAVPLLTGPGSQPPKDTGSKRSKLLTVCPFILGNEFCERLAFYGLATNLVTYLTHIMGVDAAAAAVQVMVFEGTCYVTPLLGAYLADSHWGRYTTILVFSTIYLCGCVMLTASSAVPGLTPGPTDDSTWLQKGALFAALGVIALGTGGIKPNVSAFGADQFDEKDPADKRAKESFFNFFYLAINIGSLIACTCIVYVQDTVSWTVGFALPAAAMATAVLLFVAGSRHYRHVAPTESPMARVVKVVAAALHNRWRNPHRRAPVNGAAPGTQAPYHVLNATDQQQQQQQQQQQPWLSGSSLLGSSGSSSIAGSGRPPLPAGSRGGSPLPTGNSSAVGLPGGTRGGGNVRTGSFNWLEDAITEWQQAAGSSDSSGQGGPQQPLLPQQPHRRQGGSRLGAAGPAAAGGVGGYSAQQVEEVKLVLRLLPVFATTMMYWTIYSMMGTFFIQQGSLMDNRIPLPAALGGALYIPSATMALFNTGAIIMLVPFYDAFLEPAIKRAGLRWTLLRRIGWGMVVAVLAMMYAACVEVWRLRIFRGMSGDDGGGDGPGYGPTVVPLSIMWLAPAYVLVGASEVLASIAQLEFFYDQAPAVMRSCSMALQLLSTALGSYLGGGLVAAVAAATSASGAPWLPKDLNTGHLDYFLLLCGALMAANTVLFVVVANSYEYKTVEHVVLVQVPDEEEAEVAEAGLPPSGLGLPPRAPPAAARRAGAAIAINATAARRSQYHYAAQEGSEEEGGELYSRSLAFVPASPALPAPFR